MRSPPGGRSAAVLLQNKMQGRDIYAADRTAARVLFRAKRLPLSVRASATSAASNSLWSWARRSRSAIRKSPLRILATYADTLRRLHVRLSLGEHYTDGFAGQDIIMRTPGYEYYKPELQAALQAGTKVTSEVELFFELCPCEIVAVTGSDGKTTTTTLISKMFEAAGRKVFLGGNIGAALLPQLADVTPEAVAVVELSSFQLISMRRQPEGGGCHQRDPQPSGPP